MHRFERYELTDGTYRGDVYYLTGFVEPPPDDSASFDPDEAAKRWGVALDRVNRYVDENGEVVHTDNEQVVRIDNSHGQPHIDYVFLPDSDDQRKEWLNGSWPYSKMKRFLEVYWKQYVDAEVEYR